jgi:hypothetical protein
VNLRHALLLCLPLLLLGGRTSNLDVTWIHQSRYIQDTAVTVANGPLAPPCAYWINTEEPTTDSLYARTKCYPDPERDFQITRFGVVVSEPLEDDVDECGLVVVSTDDGTAVTGTAVVSSRIQVGDGPTASNPNTLLCDLATLDQMGENCFLDLDQSDANTYVDAGGWYSVLVEDGTAAGTTCSVINGVQIFLWGYYP